MPGYRHIISAIIVLLAISIPCSATVFVDSNAPGPVYDGTSWAKAFKTIGDAVNSILGTDTTIWVRTGTYTEHITLTKGTNLYGGFLGYEATLDQRIVGAFPSIIDAAKKGIAINVTSAVQVTIDGFTIRRGLGARGGGICTVANTVAKIYNCRIEKCQATEYAGGVYYANYAKGEMNDCVITRNKAPNGGGAVVEYHSYPTFKRNVFSHNEAIVSGGGVYCPFHSGAYLENCDLVYNTAAESGGGLYAYYGGPVTLKSCIIAFNSAPQGGGLYGGGASSQATYSYCDLFENTGGDIGGMIQPQPTYAGNFSADPSFLMPTSDEFHLQQGSLCASIGAYPLGTPYKMDRIGFAKLLPAGSGVELTGKIVSCVDGGTVYIQEPDRSASISIQGLSGCTRGSIIASLNATMQVSPDGRKYIQVSSGNIASGTVYSLKPLGTRLSWLETLSGTYARTWGTVEMLEPDGFALRDGTLIIPVIYSGKNVHIGDFVCTTGVYTNEGCFIASDVQVIAQR